MQEGRLTHGPFGAGRIHQPLARGTPQGTDQAATQASEACALPALGAEGVLDVLH